MKETVNDALSLTKGYKQTEVGLIPEDWEIKKIGDVAKTEGGYAFKSSKFLSTGTYQIVKMSNVYGSLLDLNRSESFLNEIDDTEKKYLLKNGDILITLTGTVGKKDYGYTVLITKEINLLLNQRVARIVSKDTVFAPYVFFQLKMTDFSTQFFEASKGGTGNQTNVGTQQVDEMVIPLPPTLSEQKAIATALSDVDELIANLDKLITKKKAIKQGAMQQLLTPNEKWETKPLRELARYRRGSFPQPYGLAKWYDDISGMPFVQVVDVAGNNKLKPETKQRISEEGAKMSVFVKKGTIILTIQGSIGRICITQYDAYVDRTLLIFESLLEDFNKYFFMLSVWLKFQIEKENAPGGIIKTITKEALSSFEISYPNREEQDRISEIISDMEKEIEELEFKKEKYQIIKQGMMQELLTGKTRLI